MTSNQFDKDAPKGPVRSGGRAARRAIRSAPLDASIRPIKPGMPGGNFNPINPEGVARIHSAALDALETIGLHFFHSLSSPNTSEGYIRRA